MSPPTTRSRAPRFAAALVALVGCTPHEDVRDATPNDATLVAVGLTFVRDGRDGDGARFSAQGHFARFPAGELGRTATLLGLPDADELPLDGCTLVDGAEELDRAFSATSTAGIDLLDAGRLSVRGPADSTVLARRRYPELTPEVAGVVYSGESESALSLEPGALYEVIGEGGDDVGPFTASAPAPRAFPSLEPPVWRRSSDLELRWREAGEVSDPALLVVSWTSRTGARELRCRVRDDGNFAVPQKLLAVMPPPSQVARAEVTITRMRRAPFSAPGIGRGELEVSLREALPLTQVDDR